MCMLAVVLLNSILVASVEVQAVSAQNIVYVTINIDSEMWGGHALYLGTTNPNPTMDMRAYSRTSPLNVAAVMDSSFRNSHRDSFGNTFKITWFAEMDYLMSQSNYVWADGSPTGVSGYTAIHDILMNNWGAEIQAYGDSIEYHHHFYIYNGTWQRYDNGPDAGYPDYQMYALDHMIIDRSFYPSAFRAGWDIMPNSLSDWLEQWIPFDYTSASNYTSSIWYPVHPSGMNRWQVPCDDTLSESYVNAAFACAEQHGTAIYSCTCHDDNDMESEISVLQDYLVTAEGAYPTVSFRYCTALEAAQRALGYTDFTPPSFTVTPNSGTYTITSSKPLWGNQPYVALNYSDGTYTHMAATPTGTNTWTVTPPTQSVSEENVAVSSVTASSSDDYHVPSMAIDGIENPSNYWGTDATVAQGRVPQWLKLDLGSVFSVDTVYTHFYDGGVRTYTYYIQVSNDSASWTTVVPTKTGSGAVTDTFPQVGARFVRITVTANTANPAAHIEEIKIYHTTYGQLEKIGVAGSDLYGNTGVFPAPPPPPPQQNATITLHTSYYNGTWNYISTNVRVEKDSVYYGTWNTDSSGSVTASVAAPAIYNFSATYQGVFNYTTILATSGDVRSVNLYLMNSSPPTPPPPSDVQIAVSSVTASSSDDYHVPSMAIDGIENPSNYWGTDATVAQGRVPQWLKLDLGSVYSVDTVYTHFYDGGVRTYTYYIQVSNDSASWTTVVPTKTGSGAVTDTFPQVGARFVRITVTANTANPAAHIEEIRVYGPSSVPPTPPPPSDVQIAVSSVTASS